MVELPIYVRLGKRKADLFSINLNVYRNAHFYTLSKAKDLFERIVADRIRHLPPIAKADLSYRLFFGSRRAIDVSNICCIVDKFFCDTLVNQGKLIDDNMDSISHVEFDWGGMDRRNPRVEVTLSKIQTIEDNQPMQIILTQQEIEDLIRESVLQQITVREDQGISLSFDQADGLMAIIRIQKLDAEEVSPKKVRTRRTAQVEEPAQEEPAKAQVVEPVEAHTLGQETHTLTQQPAAPKIFPDVGTSAPVGTRAVDAPAAAPPGKSLFGNLTKPVHDTPTPSE